MKVLVATDGSELALHAAERGLELLGSPSDIIVLSVLSEIPGDDAGGIEGSVETPEEMEREWTEEQRDARAAIDATIASLPASVRGVAHGRTEAGSPGAYICWVAEQEDVDVVVIASHGRGGLRRAVVGSVSDHVVRHAPCPVLVVRKGADGSDEAAAG
jgi:nucleotide-binding universal stress UspA family protein